MITTVGELKALLHDYDDDATVRLAFQPEWPLQFTLGAVTALSEIESSADDECTSCGGALNDHAPDCTRDDDDEMAALAEADVIYLVAGDHPFDDTPYAKRALWGN